MASVGHVCRCWCSLIRLPKRRPILQSDPCGLRVCTSDNINVQQKQLNDTASTTSVSCPAARRAYSITRFSFLPWAFSVYPNKEGGRQHSTRSFVRSYVRSFVGSFVCWFIRLVVWIGRLAVVFPHWCNVVGCDGVMLFLYFIFSYLPLFARSPAKPFRPTRCSLCFECLCAADVVPVSQSADLALPLLLLFSPFSVPMLWLYVCVCADDDYTATMRKNERKKWHSRIAAARHGTQHWPLTQRPLFICRINW